MARRRLPERTCVACRRVRPKREMVRIVRTPAGTVEVDMTGKKSGRGAYLCRSQACWRTALRRGALSHALRTEIQPSDREALLAYSASLPAEEPDVEEASHS